MAFLDELKSKINTFAADAAGTAAKLTAGKKEAVVFEIMPTSLEEFKTCPQAIRRTPADVAALTVAALCMYPLNRELSIEMLNFLKGPQPLSAMELQFLADRFRDKDYVPRSYFDGAVPENDYEPKAPYTIQVAETPYSYKEENYVVLYLTSGGADSPRSVKLRKKPSTGEWFLWEQFLLADIRSPKTLDPWA